MSPPSKPTKKTAKKKAAKKKVTKKSVTKKASKKKTVRRKAAKKASKRAKKPAKRSLLRRLLPFVGFLVTICLVAAVMFTAYLDHTIRQQFEGKRWSLPARVYAQPLELYQGKPLSFPSLYKELEVAGYRRTPRAQQPGTYKHTGQHIRISTRDFQYWDGFVAGTTYDIKVDTGLVQSIHSEGQELAVMRIDPAQVAAIYPQHQEDRDLLAYADIPESLLKALLLIEDQKFYQHHGVRPLAIARALLVNLQAGRAVQGGSTLTQQLVKNYFLTHERSLSRKLQEAWMSVLLELHYEKNDILEAYVNEVFLGQDGDRAIHGFGLAARYYFDKPLADTSIEQQALLVAMVKGATFYNPRRHPVRAKKRRDLVLDQLLKFQVIDTETALHAKRQPLGVVTKPKSYRNRYLAFTQLVQRQLQRDYQESDLRTEGLRIFTTLVPSSQHWLEQSISSHIKHLEQRADVPKYSLQTAAIVSDSRSGEVLALAGARDPRDSGFNRALDIKRQIGSLVKPAVYLTALQQGYTAASVLDDTRFDHVGERMNVWSPQNYSAKEYGDVLLYQALINSYNISTARLGLELSVAKVSRSLRNLGLAGQWSDYPSILLGALESSPYDVAQMYQTLAGQGFYTPLRAVREVVTAGGSRLQRYPLELEQRIASREAYLINSLLQKVAVQGTAKRLASSLPGLQAAGKTGTTNDGRDTWFAGFTGEHLAVVWLGQDNNQPTSLTGSSGALPIWEGLFKNLPSRPYQATQPQDIVWAWVNESGELSASKCQNTVQLPFIKGTEPAKLAACSDKGFFDTLFNW